MNQDPWVASDSPARRPVDFGRLAWGLAIVAFGLAFFADRFDLFEIEGYGRFFPLVLTAVGLVALVTAENADRRHKALWLIGVSSWLLINIFHLFGLSWHDSWPLWLILAGVIQFIQPKRDETRRQGLWPFALGVWFLANTRHIGGFNWNNSWPILLIIVGLSIVTKALFEKRKPALPAAGERHES